MAKVEYRWREGARGPLPAQVVGTELERIRIAQGGAFVPSSVVDAARPAKSPLHPAFEWNDKIAAEKHREEQAKYLIRCIVTVTAEANEGDGEIRAFVSCLEEDEDTPSYTTTERALRDPTLRDQVLTAAFRDMEAFEKRYRKLSEMAEILTAIKKTKSRIQPERRAS
jgi:hypothetical protein